MARLNEAPLQTESLEALKRRFIRQNRDLARINTSQSLRIRSLEIEQSRLQTENLCLREEVLRLRNQLSDSLSDAQLPDLARVKYDLEQQLAALGGVVAELGRFKRPETVRPAPDPNTWRPIVPNLHLAGGLEPRMPQILEDKSFPRRTLGGDEIRTLRLSDHSNDSPDLGPPPVARFDCADPIKFDRHALEPTKVEEEPVEIPAELAVNLESRRKRRETTLRLSEAVEADLATEIVSASSAIGSRASAKRKLSVRDQDEPKLAEVAEPHPFIFTRRSSTLPNLSGGDTEEGVPESATEDEKMQPAQLTTSNARRVLGEKSVNTSPRKIVVGKKPTKSTSRLNPATDSLDLTRARARRPKTTSIPAPSPIKDSSDAPTPLPDTTPLLPNTPSASLFSPTPEPPTDPAAAANLEGVRRPSRRTRAVTSYAEPSLNTKMRRPTQALVDAVVIKAAAAAAAAAAEAKAIKPEAEPEEPDWRALEPGSPLGAKGGLVERMRELDVREGRRSSLSSSRRHSSVLSGAEAREALSSSPSTSREEVVVPAMAGDRVGTEGVKMERAGRRRSMMV